jgi:UDP-glucuronate 4-epimerase
VTILIPGGCGFIGSHLIDRLLKDGERVICFDSFDNLYNPALKWKNIEHNISNPNFKLISGSVTEPMSLEKAFSCWRIDAVVHLAAQAGVRVSVQNPALHSNVNITGTVNVLEFCRRNEVERFVFASSSSVYGNNPNVPWKETEVVTEPLCPYAASKKAGELICYTYHYLHKMDIACIRPFTVYGPRQRTDMAIPLFTRLIHHKAEMTVHGGDEVKRDFTYVDDVVDGIVKILSKKHGYEIYNLGSGKAILLSDLVFALENRLKKDAVIKHAPLMEGEATMTYADITKAKESFGYDPKHTIQDGLDKYIEWYLNDAV